jgi:HK97 family phage major capsid protein
MRLQELREQRGTVAVALNALVNKADYDPATDGPAYDKGITDLNRIDAQMSAIAELNERIAEQSVTHDAADKLAKHGRDKNNPAAALYAKWLKGGDNALNAEEWQTVRNTMSTTTGSEGGFTTPAEVSSTLIEALKAYGGMRTVADVIVTESGSALSYPTSDGTAEEGEIIAENVTATDLDVAFGTVPLNVFKFSSKVITVPFELLQDSAIDIDALINARIVTRLGRITNKMFTIGTGSGQPTGVAVGATVGVTAANSTSQVTAVTYDSLVNLQHSVDPAYREGGNCRFMFNDTTLREVRKIKDGQQRPIFVPGYELSVPGGAPDMLLGSPITVNQHMANMAANARSILYGDFKGYTIRDAMMTSMFRFTDSAFTKKGQVGFLAWSRHGGNLTDTGAVRVFVNAAS